MNDYVRHSTNSKIPRTFLYRREHGAPGLIMDWDDLRVFLPLARDGSLTAAPRRLEVRHPTVARPIQALEGAPGARLFYRLPDRVVVTAGGRADWGSAG